MTIYMFSLIDDESWFDGSPQEWDADMKLHADFCAAVEAAGCTITGGAALDRQSTATVVHRSGNDTRITDGPFVEAKEVIGGLYLIEAPNLDVALELAAVCPAPHVEVRPALDLSDE